MLAAPNSQEKILIRQMIHEVELRPQRLAARVQQHPAVRSDIAACAAGDGENRIGAIIVEWPLDGDIASFQEDRPEALPFGLAGRHCAGALPVVNPHLTFVRGIKHRIVER